MFQIPHDLHRDLYPLAWLLGGWEGDGVGGYPTLEGDFRFEQRVDFTHDGRPFLAYTSRTWLLDTDGQRVRPLSTETGFWRILPDNELEVLLTHPTGLVEIWLGGVDSAKIELRTDVVARTTTAKDVTAGHRLYGLVEGDLLWAYDMAAEGHPLQPHLSGRLRRTGLISLPDDGPAPTDQA